MLDKRQQEQVQHQIKNVEKGEKHIQQNIEEKIDLTNVNDTNNNNNAESMNEDYPRTQCSNSDNNWKRKERDK